MEAETENGLKSEVAADSPTSVLEDEVVFGRVPLFDELVLDLSKCFLSVR